MVFIIGWIVWNWHTGKWESQQQVCYVINDYVIVAEKRAGDGKKPHSGSRSLTGYLYLPVSLNCFHLKFSKSNWMLLKRRTFGRNSTLTGQQWTKSHFSLLFFVFLRRFQCAVMRINPGVMTHYYEFLCDCKLILMAVICSFGNDTLFHQ